MKTIHAYKAQPVGSTTPEAVTIIIKAEFPASLEMKPDAAEAAMMIDAQQIARALWEALPGGTLDRLCGELLQRQASRLLVARR